MAGDLLDGARLPSLTALSERYGATHDAVRQAIAILRDERLVETRHGAGTFVRRFPMIVRSSPGRLSREHWGSGAAIQDAETGSRLRVRDIVVGEVPAPEVAADALGVALGEPVLSRSRRYVVDARPVQLSTSWLPLDIVRGSAITYTDAGPGGSYARLAELGYGPDRFTERVAARAPLPDERTALALPGRGALVFEVTRFAYAGERCVEVNLMILDSAVYSLEFSFPA